MFDKIKTIHIVTLCLTFLATVAMFTGQPELAYIAVGALVGWIGGNKNGSRSDT